MKTALLRLGLPTGITLVMLALAVVPIGVAVEAPDKSSPTSQFLTAYNSMSLADWLKAKGLRTEATDLYTEALNLFLKVSADYPQWQPAVVSFRINYCREALKRLQGPETEAKDDGLPTDLSTVALAKVEAPGAKAGRQTLLRQGATEVRRQTTENQQPGSAGQAPPERLPLRDSPSRSAMAEQGSASTVAKAMADKSAEQVGGQAPGNGKSAIGNQAPPERFAQASRKSEINNRSPLNFRLQQAALKERGRDYTGALAMYSALLEEYPQEPWALKGACRCCLRLGRMDKARALTRQALALPLPDADLNLLAALVDCQDGRYQAAIPRLRQSLKQNGACPEAHAALGVALAASSAMKEAQEEMKRALSLNPKLGDAYYNLARLSLWQKPTDHDTARVHYQNALRHGAAPDPELDALLAE